MEETLELRELVNIIYKGKFIVILSTIVCMLLASILSWFILEEKYESRAMVQIVNKTQDMGVISDYITTEFKPNVYAERIQNEAIMQQVFSDNDISTEFLLENLSVVEEMDPLKSSVVLKYTSNDALKAQQELKILMNATVENMGNSIQTSLKNLEEQYKKEIANISPQIEKDVDLYNKIIQTNELPNILILQMLVDASGGIVINATEQQKDALTNVDGNLQNQLVKLQAEIGTKLEEYKKALANYESIKISLNSFKPDAFIRVITEPTIAKQPTSPSKMLNVALGIIIGLMVGLAVVFMRAYWKNSTPIN